MSYTAQSSCPKIPDQSPVVIYRTTSSSADNAPRGMDFLYDPHRLNVATSRSKSMTIMVASPTLFHP
ncbi:hypothetical protein [Rhodopirellula europaea]|uniref:hypothetical protein n=1 Tax=Rhodopirellula europaea TaxID=1263866 RepID=UPI0030ED613C